MGVEFDNPTNLHEMHQIVQEWIFMRPTIHHTKETLQRIRRNELEELYTAVTQHKSQLEITEEVGDVLFSTLSLDKNLGSKANNYEFFESFCKMQDISLIKLFKQTHDKNRINYPIEFFNEMSPFKNSVDTISCLRILRSHYANNLEVLDKFWADSDTARFALPFTDDWEFNGIFRKFILDKLSEISKNLTKQPMTQKEITRLKKVGHWDKVPLNDIDSRLSWTRWRQRPPNIHA